MEHFLNPLDMSSLKGQARTFRKVRQDLDGDWIIYLSTAFKWGLHYYCHVKINWIQILKTDSSTLQQIWMEQVGGGEESQNSLLWLSEKSSCFVRCAKLKLGVFSPDLVYGCKQTTKVVNGNGQNTSSLQILVHVLYRELLVLSSTFLHNAKIAVNCYYATTAYMISGMNT